VAEVALRKIARVIEWHAERVVLAQVVQQHNGRMLSDIITNRLTWGATWSTNVRDTLVYSATLKENVERRTVQLNQRGPGIPSRTCRAAEILVKGLWEKERLVIPRKVKLMALRKAS
jgi:hypothetical protein